MVRAILFDLFGTLIEYAPSRHDGRFGPTHALLTAGGIPCTYGEFAREWEAAVTAMDDRSRLSQREYTMDDLAGAFLARVSAIGQSDAWVRGLWLSYLEDSGILRPARFPPDLPSLLRDLRRRYRLGIVSNTHYSGIVDRQIDNMGIRSDLSAILTSDLHGAPKPAISIFLAAAVQLDLAPDEIVFVGDSYRADYIGSSAAGMRAVLIDPARTSGVPEEHLIGSVMELPTRISAFG